MDFEKNDVAVGAFVLGVVAVFLAAVILVNRERVLSKSYPLFIELREVAGIDKGVDVMYRGYRAGQVDRVTVTYEPQFRFVVEFSIKSDIRLPVGSKVLVRGRGFTGGRYLDLIPAEKGSTSVAVPENARLPVELEPDLMAKANDVLGQARTFVKRFEEQGTVEDVMAIIHDSRVSVGELRALMAENRIALKETLAQTRAATEVLARRGPELDRSIKNIDQTLVHAPSVMKHVEELVADLKKHPWRLLRKGGETTPDLDHKHGDLPAAPPPPPAPASQPPAQPPK